MATINLHNYEAFLLDYYEGNLNDKLCDELQQFVITHPELEIDLDDKILPVFEAETLEADFKLHLKKTELNFPDEVLLNYLDDNLPQAERKAFEDKLLENKELASDLELYKKTILPKDPAIRFENKSSLLKTEDDIVLNNRLLAYFENELSASEKQAFELELNTDKALQTELALMYKTKLLADPAVIYPAKAALKKEAKILVLFSVRRLSGIAAAILLLFVLGFIFNYYTSRVAPVNVLAKKDQPVIKQNNQKIRDTGTSAIPAVKETHSAQPVKAAQKIKMGSIPANQQVRQAPENENPVADNRPFEKKTTTDPLKETVTADKDKAPEQLAEKKPLPVYTNTAVLIPQNLDSDQAVVKVLTESEDELEDDSEPTKNGFWKKAVKLAQRANHLGVKSVDGVEKPNSRFSLSFNAFSVERH